MLSKQKRLFFDIETAANADALAFMPSPEAPANLKDPEKIAAAIEAKRLEQIERAALDPDYGKILSIGFSYGGEVHVLLNREVYYPPPDGLASVNTVSEADMLRVFWKELALEAHGCCVGYNVLGFDLPYLLRRSFALGIRPHFPPNLARFRTEPVTDLMMILYNWGSDRYKSLKLVAKLYGLPVVADDIDGSMVASLDADQIARYQISDVKLVMALHERMNGVYFNH